MKTTHTIYDFARPVVKLGLEGIFQGHDESWLGSVYLDDVRFTGDVGAIVTALREAADLLDAALAQRLAEAEAAAAGAEVTHLPPTFTDAEIAEAFKVEPAEDPALEPCERGAD